MAHAFVGRDAECREFEALLAAAENHSPATVMLDGEAGVGKTRLLNEFAEKTKVSGAFVLAGGCIPLGGGAIPYGPLIEALRLLVRQNGLPKARQLAGPAWSELAGLVADFTGGEPPAAMPGAQVRVFGAVSRLLDHIGRYAPLVLIFEDIHWADPSTLDLIAYLTQMKSDQRMLLVCSYRSGLAPDHPLRTMLAEPKFTRRMHRISLPRFTDAELRHFIATLMTRPVSPERVERYLELSEGIPYFAEQLVTADDPDRPTPRIPDSLNEIMRLRLARLSEPARRVVRVAAVAGRRVSDSLLASVIKDDASLDDALRECLNHRILLADNQVDEAYSFQHALLREAAYDTISPRERRRLHAAMAETLAAEADERPRLLPELAYHWFEAERKPEALAATVRAGASAVRMRAFQEAETQYRRALDLWARVPDAEVVAGVARPDVLRMAADAARWAGHVHRAVDWARQAMSEADPDADRPRAGELFERLGSYLWEAGQFGESVEAYRQARGLLTGSPPSAVSSRVQSALATAAVRDGQHTEALRLARRATEEARSVGARPEEGRALNSAGLALTMLGRPDEGEAALRESLRIATEVDHLEDMLRAYGNLGVCLAHAGRLAAAVAVQLEGLEKARGLGVLHTRQGGVLANNAGAVLFLQGRWDKAAALLDEVLLHRPLSETLYQRLTKAEIDLARGRFEEAGRLLEGIRSHPNKDPRFITPLYVCLAELAFQRADPEAARSAVVHGIEAVARTENTLAPLQLCAIGLRIAADELTKHALSPQEREKLGDWARELVTMTRRGGGDSPPDAESAVLERLCEAEERRMRDADTQEPWSEIAEAWSGLDRPYPRAYAMFRGAESAARAGDKPAASAAARIARAIVEELDARPLLAQIDALVKRHRLNVTETRKRTARPFDLTERELEVLHEVTDGLTNGEIGKKLNVSPKTVSVHLSSVFRKLGVGSRTEAAAKARKRRLFGDERHP